MTSEESRGREKDKGQEKAIDLNFEYFKGILESPRDLVVRVSPEGGFTYVNDAYCQTFGKKREELLGTPFMSLVHPEDLEKTLEEMQKLYVPPYRASMEQRAMTAQGYRWLVWHDYAIRDREGKILEIQAIGRDINAQKEAEEELAKHRDRLVEAQHIARVGSWEWDLAAGRMYWSDEIYRLMDVEPQSFQPVEGSCREFIHPEDLQAYEQAVEASKKGRAYDLEYRFISAKGRQGWVTEKCEFKYDSSGNIAMIYGTLQDITQRKALEERLRESEERYRQLVENSPDAIIVHSEGKVVFANPATAKVLRLAGPEELVGRRVTDFLHKDFLDMARAQVQILLKGKATSFKEMKVLASDGRVVEVETSEIPFTHRKKPAVIVVLRDVTNRRKMEEEMIKASKLESIGVLAGGIAHDFNNLLTIILGNISLAKLYTGEGNPRVARKLAEIEKASLQAKSLIQQLQTFAKGGAPLKQSTAMGELIREAAAFAVSGSPTRCECSFAEGMMPVEIDRVQVVQVINNIILNAVQAMPQGGTIRIKGESFHVGPEGVEGVPLKKGEYVKISFQDQGGGVPQHHIPLVFDPFFTTKKEGSGLGLAICYSIIKRHNGHIDVESREGEGSTFSIYLPVSPDAGPGEKEERNNHLYRGSGRILVMDDEEAIRRVAGEILNYLGYEASLAADGQEAAVMYEEAYRRGEPYDLVIMDLTVPGGMGGKEAIGLLLKVDPAVKAVVSSGYSSDLVMANFSKYGFRDMVAKPYRIEELGRVLHRILKG